MPLTQDLLIAGVTAADVASFQALLNFDPTHVEFVNGAIYGATFLTDVVSVWTADWLGENTRLLGYSLVINTDDPGTVFTSNPSSIPQPIKQRVKMGINGQNLTLVRRTPGLTPCNEQVVGYVIHLRFHRE